MRRRGFTLIELTVVVTIAAIIVTIGGLTFSGYFQRSSARRAAQVFARDLTTARSAAVRAQESVVLRFYEGTRWYEIVTRDTSSEVARRRFTGSAADIDLSEIELNVPGDSVVFNARGHADLSGLSGALGEASFSSGRVTYRVSFNSLGASKVEET